MSERGTEIVLIFQRARDLRQSAADLVAEHGHKLHRRGKQARGACPLCGAGATSEAFSAQSQGGLWHCWACDQGGDLIDLERLLGGHASPLAAACALLGEPLPGTNEPVRRRTVVPVEQPFDEDASESELVDSAAVAAWLRETAVPATGTIVEQWLDARGLDPHAIPGALERLRFHPHAPVAAWAIREDADRARPPLRVPRAPAMIAPLTRWIEGRQAGSWTAEDAGVHVTYLSADGRTKAEMRRADGSQRKARKIWGAAGRAGFALTPVDGAGVLLAGEGIETTWAVAQTLLRRGAAAVRAIATISLSNLQGGALRDSHGVIDLFAPIADPERRPTLIPHAGDVAVLVDADMKPIEAQVRRRPRERATRQRLGALDRANLCASLAAQAWRGAGASSVTALRPPIGMDFNDWIREAL